MPAGGEGRDIEKDTAAGDFKAEFATRAGRQAGEETGAGLGPVGTPKSLIGASSKDINTHYAIPIEPR